MLLGTQFRETLTESSSFKSMSLVKSETAHRTTIKVVTSKEGAESEQEVAEGEHGEATSEQGRAETKGALAREQSGGSLVRVGLGTQRCYIYLYMYIYILYDPRT